jgi:hypothetical protein
VPRRNNRDRRYAEPKDYNNNEGKFSNEYDKPSEKQKPVRRRKGKWDKSIYKESE